MQLIQPQTAERERPRITNVDRTAETYAAHDPDLYFELALWTRGLECFCSVGRQAFSIEKTANLESRNYKNEFHITRAVLFKCSELIDKLGRDASVTGRHSGQEITALRDVMQTLTVANGALVRNAALDFAEWAAWCEIVSERIERNAIYRSLDHLIEEHGIEYLPELLVETTKGSTFDAADREDLQHCLPRLGGILKALDVIRRMLSVDAPLKPALAIFAYIYETVNELIFEIGGRLSAREDETGEVFAMLDAATYTLAIESRKVFSHELASVIGTRSATLVFARVESAFGLLNDNIRHLLAGFAKLAEPGTEATDLFPEFIEKLDQSVKLRESLWSIMNAVRSTEIEPTDLEMEKLRPQLAEFLRSRISFLFYKDRETFERFCSEIIVSSSGPDVRPLLHRFSAYVETLFNQVGMRTVLANHPFDPDDRNVH